MAINLKEYPNQVKPNLKANIKYDMFYYRFRHNKKAFYGLIDYSKKSWTKRDRIKYAESELLKAKEEALSLIDTDATINSIVDLYLDTLTAGTYKSHSKS